MCLLSLVSEVLEESTYCALYVFIYVVCIMFVSNTFDFILYYILSNLQSCIA